jgi:hypothetical protein
LRQQESDEGIGALPHCPAISWQHCFSAGERGPSGARHAITGAPSNRMQATAKVTLCHARIDKLYSISLGFAIQGLIEP